MRAALMRGVGILVKPVSFVIPCRDDTGCLRDCLRALVALEPMPELVVADASRDRGAVRDVSAEFGAVLVEVGEPGRGGQLEAGARVATGEVIVFLHADSEFGQRHYDSLLGAFRGDNLLGGGAFFKELRFSYPSLAMFSGIYRLYARYVGTLYGDQGVFVAREVFEAMGGMGPLPLMEDVAFSSRLRDAARVRVLDPPLRSSARKFEAEGRWRRKLKNMWLVALFRLGVSPERLYRMYYGESADRV